MQKKSGQVALGGIATGMCIALMFATGMIPFSYYALPALAGLVLIAVREENGLSTALIVFAAVSLLSVFVVPIKEAALLFAALGVLAMAGLKRFEKENGLPRFARLKKVFAK